MCPWVCTHTCVSGLSLSSPGSEEIVLLLTGSRQAPNSTFTQALRSVSQAASPTYHRSIACPHSDLFSMSSFPAQRPPHWLGDRIWPSGLMGHSLQSPYGSTLKPNQTSSSHWDPPNVDGQAGLSTSAGEEATLCPSVAAASPWSPEPTIFPQLSYEQHFPSPGKHHGGIQWEKNGPCSGRLF